jgi:hypothetical protein
VGLLQYWTHLPNEYKQSFLKANERAIVVDPVRSPLILIDWISIRIHVGQNEPKKGKSEEMFCLEVLDVPFCSHVAWMSFTEAWR